MPDPPRVHFYVYYRIAASQSARARAAAVATVIGAMRRQFAVSGRTLRGRDDGALWMEVYEDVADPLGFEAALAASIAGTDFLRRALAPGSSRRIERFVASEK